MVKKFRKGEPRLEGTLQAILEVNRWQAELVRAALRQARALRAGVGYGSGVKKKPVRRRRGRVDS